MPLYVPLETDLPNDTVAVAARSFASRYCHLPPFSSVYVEPSAPTGAPLAQFWRSALPAS